MSIKKQSEQQIYGRNDMIMLEQNNKIYGSLGLADRYVMKTEEGTRLILSNPKLGSFDDVLTEFVIYGMSKQVVTTGKNLCSIKSCQLSMNIVSSDVIAWTKSSRVYYAFDTQNISGAKAYISIKYHDADKKIVGSNGSNPICDGTRKIGWFSGLDAQTGGSDIDLTTIEYISVQLGLYTASVVPSFIDNIMVCDEENQTYEPYTGGKPSPSPEYPQEIVSVGGNGSIGVEITGKNLFDLSKEYTSTSVVNTFTFTLKPSTKYTLSTDFPATVNVASIYFGGPSSNINGVWKDRPKTFATDSSGNMIVHIRTLEQDNAPAIFNDVLNGVYHIQLEEGNTATSYEPYHEPQSFSISTPTGLPAIPVPSDTSGITYTDTDGQAWIADEIDFSRGKYIQKVWQAEFDGSEDEEWKKGGINYIHIECLPVAMSNREGFRSQYIVGNNIRGIRIGNGNVSLIIFDDFSDENALSNFKANLSANPLKVMTYLDTPIETDITQEEIKDYQSLVTYDGTTIVENDAECYTKITYMAKGN
jgi:hypothetical protein